MVELKNVSRPLENFERLYTAITISLERSEAPEALS